MLNINKIITYIPNWLFKPLLYLFVIVNKIRLQIVNRPDRIIFLVTNKCNLKCSHCLYQNELNTGTNDLSLDEIKSITYNYKKKLHSLLITGGEPFIRNDIYDIIKSFYNDCRLRMITINTNGFYPKKIITSLDKVQKYMPKLHIHLSVSIDGFEKTHNNIRQNNHSFQNAVKTIINILDRNYHNIKLSILSTINKSNVDEIIRFHRSIESEFNVSHRIRLPDTINISEFKMFKNDQLIDIIEKLLPLYNKNNLVHRKQRALLNLYWNFFNKNTIPGFKCYAGRADFILKYDGSIGYCEHITTDYNIRDFNYNLTEIYRLIKNQERCNKICVHPCHSSLSLLYTGIKKFFGH